MPKVIIYTTDYCPYCQKAKDLLTSKGVKFSEIDVTGDDTAREKLVIAANGMKTVPQIFINDKHIGGYDTISGMDREGKLDALLNN